MWTGFSTQRLQTKLLSKNTTWIGFSTSDFKQKLLSNSKGKVDRFFPPVISTKLLSNSKDNVDRFFHQRFQTKITQQFKRERGQVFFSTSDFKQNYSAISRTSGQILPRRDLKQYTQRFQVNVDRFFHTAFSSQKYSAISRTSRQILPCRDFKQNTTNHIKRGDLQLVSPTRS